MGYILHVRILKIIRQKQRVKGFHKLGQTDTPELFVVTDMGILSAYIATIFARKILVSLLSVAISFITKAMDSSFQFSIEMRSFMS